MAGGDEMKHGPHLPMGEVVVAVVEVDHILMEGFSIKTTIPAVV